jgi:hypothetical protein
MSKEQRGATRAIFIGFLGARINTAIAERSPMALSEWGRYKTGTHMNLAKVFFRLFVERFSPASELTGSIAKKREAAATRRPRAYEKHL